MVGFDFHEIFMGSQGTVYKYMSDILSQLEDQEVIAAQQLLWQQMQEQQKLKFGRSPFTTFTAASYHEGEQ